MKPERRFRARRRLQRPRRWTRLATETSFSVSNRLTGMRALYNLSWFLVAGLLLAASSVAAQHTNLPGQFASWTAAPSAASGSSLPQPLHQELGGGNPEAADYTSGPKTIHAVLE